jgi:hypothetical protein
MEDAFTFLALVGDKVWGNVMQEVSLFLESFKDYSSVFQGSNPIYGIGLLLFFVAMVWIFASLSKVHNPRTSPEHENRSMAAAAFTGVILELIRWPEGDKDLFYRFLRNEGMKTAIDLFECSQSGLRMDFDEVQSRSKQDSALSAILNRYIKDCFSSHKKWINELFEKANESSEISNSFLCYTITSRDLLIHVTDAQSDWIARFLESGNHEDFQGADYRIEGSFNTVFGCFIHLVDSKFENEGNGKFKFEALVSVIPEL